ncbi:MAG: Trm112 family protein [Thermoplasmata archaeon]
MQRAALSVLACPNCLGPLVASGRTDNVDEGDLTCQRERLVFPVEAGIPHLVRPKETAVLDEFAQSYSQA